MPAFRKMKDIGAPTHTFLTINFCYRVLENITEYHRVHLAHQLRPFFGIVSQGLVGYFFPTESCSKLETVVLSQDPLSIPFSFPILFGQKLSSTLLIALLYFIIILTLPRAAFFGYMLFFNKILTLQYISTYLHFTLTYCTLCSRFPAI